MSPRAIGLGRFQVALVAHQGPPVAARLAQALEVGAGPIDLGEGRAAAPGLFERPVVRLQALAAEPGQAVEYRQVVVGEAAGRELELAVADPETEGGQVLVGAAAVEQGLGLVEEPLVVTDGVQDHQMPLARMAAQAAAELLQEQDLGVDQVVVAQARDVRLVRALRGGGQPKQKARPEVLQQAPIDRGGGVVEFVHHQAWARGRRLTRRRGASQASIQAWSRVRALP